MSCYTSEVSSACGVKPLLISFAPAAVVSGALSMGYKNLVRHHDGSSLGASGNFNHLDAFFSSSVRVIRGPYGDILSPCVYRPSHEVHAVRNCAYPGMAGSYRNVRVRLVQHHHQRTAGYRHRWACSGPVIRNRVLFV